VDSISLFPADFQGKTLYLGTPVHLQVEQLVDPRYIIQMPPKHVDFLPKDPSNPDDWNNQENWEIVNVSAFSNFYVQLTTSETGTVTTKSTDKTSSETSSSTTYDVSASGAGKFAGFSPFKIEAGYKDVVTESTKNTETVQEYSSKT